MKCFSVSALIVLLLFKTVTPVLSNGLEVDHSRESVYRDVGYTSVEQAAHDFKQHYNEDLKLPLRLPPIPFTHVMGRVNDLDGDAKDSFEVKYINEKFPDNHYKIIIRPLQYKIDYSNKDIIRVLKLKHGDEAVFLDHSGFNVLAFERGKWQYMLSINKNGSELMLPGTLVQIANSIEH
jgi:hypothetical protein